MSVAFIGKCHEDILSDAALTFDLSFVWENFQALGTSSSLDLVTPVLRAGYWDFYYSQTDPTEWTAVRPGYGDEWILGNYLIDGSINAGPPLIELDTPEELSAT